jgi:hypothetical protein
MDDQRVPNLEELDEQQAQHFLVELFSNLSAEEEYKIRHEDYTLEMPQSGERIRGREKMRAFQEAYPNPPSIQIRRVLVRDRLWVVEGVNDYGGGQRSNVVLIVELRDGKWWRDTRYYADPFEVPEWRARWVERMEARVGSEPTRASEKRFCRKLGEQEAGTERVKDASPSPRSIS